MVSTQLAGNPVTLAGDFPEVGSIALDFIAIQRDLSEFTLDHFKGKRKILNIFPSIDTDVCAISVKTFNEKAAGLDNTQVICLSHDLPFAHKRFCADQGIENLITGSLYRDPAFARSYGVGILDGPLTGLTARAVVVLDENNVVLHAQLVPEITQEPDYQAALAVI